MHPTFRHIVFSSPIFMPREISSQYGKGNEPFFFPIWEGDAFPQWEKMAKFPTVGNKNSNIFPTVGKFHHTNAPEVDPTPAPPATPPARHHRKGKGTRRRYTAAQAPEVDTMTHRAHLPRPAGRAHHHRPGASSSTGTTARGPPSAASSEPRRHARPPRPRKHHHRPQMNLSPRKSALPRLRTSSPQGSTRRKHTAGKPPEVDTMTHRAHLPRPRTPNHHRPAQVHPATTSGTSPRGHHEHRKHAPGGKQGPARASSPRAPEVDTTPHRPPRLRHLPTIATAPAHS